MSEIEGGEYQVLAVEVERIIRRVVVRRRPARAHTDTVAGEVVDEAAPVAAPTPSPVRPSPSPAIPAPPLPEFDLAEPSVSLFSLLGALEDADPMSAVLGVDEDDTPLLLRLDAGDVGNVLIAGAPGAGKTTLLRTMVLSLAIANAETDLRVALIDPSGRARAALGGLPHLVASPAVTPREVDTLMRQLLREVDDRRHQAGRAEPCIVVAVSQPTDLVRAVGPLIIGDLIHLACDGNGVGVYLLCSEAQPGRLADELLARFPVRLVGCVPDAEAAFRVAGRRDTRAEALAGRGDFVAVTAGDIVRFSAAACDALDARRAVAALAAGHAQGRFPLRAH